MNMYVICVAAVSLAVTLTGWIISGKAVNDGVRRWPVYLLYFLNTVVTAVLLRQYQETEGALTVYVALLKFCASLPSVLLALRGYLMEKNRFDLKIVIAMAFCLLADVTINIALVAGGTVFAIAHVLFAEAFISEHKPSGKQILAWIIGIIIEAVILYLIRDKVGSVGMYIFALVYLAIMLSTVILSYPLNKLVFASAVVFAVSDCFLITNMAIPSTPFMRLMALLIYYISLHLYGIAVWEISYPHERI